MSVASSFDQMSGDLMVSCFIRAASLFFAEKDTEMEPYSVYTTHLLLYYRTRICFYGVVFVLPGVVVSSQNTMAAFASDT